MPVETFRPDRKILFSYVPAAAIMTYIFLFVGFDSRALAAPFSLMSGMMLLLAYLMWNTSIILGPGNEIRLTVAGRVCHDFFTSEVQSAEFATHYRGVTIRRIGKGNVLRIIYKKMGEQKTREMMIFRSAYKTAELDRIREFIKGKA